MRSTGDDALRSAAGARADAVCGRTDASMTRSRRIAAGIGAALLAITALAGCSAGRRGVAATTVIGADIDDLEPESLAVAAERSARVLRASKEKTVKAGGRRYDVAELAASAERVAEIARKADGPEDMTRTLARECSSTRSGERAKVTAYYEPLLAARREPSQRFRYPIYAAPTAAQLALLRTRLGRVPTRADIDYGQALEGLRLELAWVDDPVARFFLHVQGSGRLAFDDGTETRVGYAATNGLAYQSIGAVMVQRGLLAREEATAPAIRSWLTANPKQRDELLATNARYVFFRDTGTHGPIGAMGTKLVRGRSIAVDPKHVPHGIVGWLETTWPDVGYAGEPEQAPRRMRRFVVAQDAGAAIQGPGRVDLFWGSGEEAGFAAGSMNESGELYLLVCRAPKDRKSRR